MEKQRDNKGASRKTRSVTIRMDEQLYEAYERESIRLHIGFSELIRNRLSSNKHTYFASQFGNQKKY